MIDLSAYEAEWADAPLPPDPAGEYDTDWREQAIARELDTLRIRLEARRRLNDEARPPIEPPPVKALGALLSEPDEATAYRIDRVAPAGARIVLSAQYKAGKTTLVGNLMRSLVDADPFLGRFTVHRPVSGLVLIDDELSTDTLRRWLRDQNIANAGAVTDVVALRGRVGSFNLLDDRIRSRWSQRLRDVGCDYLILDCLRPVLDALGLDEHRDAGRFLVNLDALLSDANVGDAAVVQHMGHAGERARGDSRLQDWPDAIWTLVREDDAPDSARYFKAYGRDVDVREGRLSFDPATRRLAYAEGSRSDAQSEAALRAIIDLLASAPGLSGRAIEDALEPAHKREAIRTARGNGLAQGLIIAEDGPHRSKLHRIANPCSECSYPVTGGGPRHQSCPGHGEKGLLQ